MCHTLLVGSEHAHAGLKHYEARRGYADARSVSRVSPYLRWGQLSPRHMLQRVAQVPAADVQTVLKAREQAWSGLAPSSHHLLASADAGSSRRLAHVLWCG